MSITFISPNSQLANVSIIPLSEQKANNIVQVVTVGSSDKLLILDNKNRLYTNYCSHSATYTSSSYKTLSPLFRALVTLNVISRRSYNEHMTYCRRTYKKEQLEDRIKLVRNILKSHDVTLTKQQTSKITKSIASKIKSVK